MGLFRGHTTVNRANKISEFTVATAEYGAAVPEILGTTRVSGNVIYYDDFTAHEHRQTQRTGKGGRSKSVSISYTYTVAVILGLCEGEIGGLGRVWIGKDQYTYPSDQIQMTLYKGTEDQKPWPQVTGKHPEKALPYKGLAYMAGVIDMGESASLPNYNFEVKGKLLDTGDGVDINPADYIRYILDKVGLKDTEIVGLDNYRQYCKAADLLISTPMDQTDAKEAREIINEITQLTNAYMFWSNDKFKIVCADDREYDGWKPNRTISYDLTSDDFIPQNGGALVTYSRKDSSEIYNQFPVQYTSRENGYEKETVSYALTQDIADYGLRQASTLNADYIYTKERAVKIAETLARKAQYERNRYTFKLDWAFCRLEVGDLVTLTDANCGLDKQPAIVDSVVEGTDGLLTVTAISRAKGEYSAAQFDVHANDRPFVDYNASAPDTDKPVILQPPAELTQNGLEVWIGARGTGDNWGGCQVYVSDNNNYYRYAGQIAASARIGTLAKAAGADATSIEIESNGDFLSGTQQDAERGNTLCWLGGECFSYQTATLLQNGHYRLDGCIRGQYNTKASSHPAGVEFARLDSALLKLPFLKEDIGKKVYLKVASYNIFGGGEQDLSNLDAYEYTILPYYIPPIENLSAHNRYRQLVDGVARYDVEVNWEPPADMTSYLEGQVWYKTNYKQGEALIIKEGVPASELGYQNEWTFAGAGQNKCTIPQAIVGDRYLIAVTTKDKWGAVTSPDTAPTTELLVARKSTVPNSPEGFGITFGEAVNLSWNEVTNADIAYYEVRTDQNAGADTPSLIVRTLSLSASVTLTDRKGTLYLYACNAQGRYSYPTVLGYNKPKPDAPTGITVTPALRGATIRTDAIPKGSFGLRLYIDGTDATNRHDVVDSRNPLVVYQCEPDVYTMTACYIDVFGEGEKSQDVSFTVKPYLDPAWIEKESLTLEKLDKSIQQERDTLINTTIPDLDTRVTGVRTDLDGLSSTVSSNKSDTDKAISAVDQKADGISSTVTEFKKSQDGKNTTYDGYASQIKQNSDNITTIVTNLGDTDKAKNAYSAIKQMSNDINLRVKQNDVINQINISTEGVRIDGDKVYITGDTQFDDNVIVNKMLAANSITADKLSASTISLSNKQGIQGGAVKLDTNGMRVTESNGNYVQYGSGGVKYYTASGNVFNAITPIMYVEGKDGQYCKFNGAWSATPIVMMIDHNMTRDAGASSFVTSIENKNEYESDAIFLTKPSDISKNGFHIWSSERYTKGDKVGTAFEINGERYKLSQIVDKTFGNASERQVGNVYYSESYSNSSMSVSWSNQNTESLNEKYDITGVYMLKAPSTSKNVTALLTYSGDRANNYNAQASASIEFDFLVNNVSKTGVITRSDDSDESKTITFDVNKGDTISIKFTCHNQNAWAKSQAGWSPAHAFAYLRAEISNFTLTDDLVLASGSARYLVFDSSNRQYTLE